MKAQVIMSGSQHTLEILHDEDDGRGVFHVDREGLRLAEMTYVRAAEALVIIDHTEVHEALRGLGVARQLLDAAVAWARATGTRIRATCPYASAQFERDPSIQDVLAS
jgi:predicted GNAT family acetyltransferase